MAFFGPFFRGSLGSEDEHHFVHVTPAPVFTGFDRTCDGVPDLVCVVAGMPIRRRIAAADLAAGLAHPQVQPAAADLQALLAAGDRALRLEEDHLIEMRAVGHVVYTITR